MTEALSLPQLGPLSFFLLFAALWLGVSALLSLLNGWSSLAKQFRASPAPNGDRFRFVSGSLGVRFFPANYSSCLFLTVGAQGIRIAILFPFRFLNPPLFIPWAMVESVVQKKRLLFFSYARIRIRNHWPILSIYG